MTDLDSECASMISRLRETFHATPTRDEIDGWIDQMSVDEFRGRLQVETFGLPVHQLRFGIYEHLTRQAFIHDKKNPTAIRYFLARIFEVAMAGRSDDFDESRMSGSII